MINQCFKTARLTVVEITKLPTGDELTAILKCVVKILTPVVVKNLPPYFHNIKSTSDAQVWLARMMTESRLYLIQHNNDNVVIGFTFLSEESNRSAHIGYLLDQQYWQQGLAKEILSAFLTWAETQKQWHDFIGGVDKNNLVSAHLLTKLGFVKQPVTHQQVNFYQYIFKQ